MHFILPGTYRDCLASLRLAKRDIIERAGLKRGATSGFLIFQMLCRFLVQIKVLYAGLEKLVDSPITSGDRVQKVTPHYLAEMFQRLSTTLLQIGACNKPYLHVGIHHPFPIFQK